VIGLEVNSRTFLDSIAFRSDPMWLTPSVQLRTPYYMNVLVGADISLSKERSTAVVRSLEQFRIFGGLDFTMDVLAGKKRAQADKAKQAEIDKQEMEKKQKQLQAEADSLTKKAKADSIAAEQQRLAEKRRADSLAQKAVQDSIALAETKRKLQEEMSKRSDAEKQLLSTGMLLLDAVYFESGRTEISINSKPYLNIIGKMLSKYPKLQLQVAGHTDNVGRIESNRRLSFARAESVRQYLVSVSPDLANRLAAVGYGPDQPKADNRTAAGRKVNRRVELQVLNKEVLKEYNQ
jgi:outer membrane protein OmpA-like peptidoglycan-associated protein